MEKLNARLGIGRLRDFIKVDAAVFEQRLPAMAGAALASGSPQNNPVVPTADEMIELYRQVLVRRYSTMGCRNEFCNQSSLKDISPTAFAVHLMVGFTFPFLCSAHKLHK